MLQCSFTATQQLAAIPTRPAAMDDLTQQRLANWGYGICDAAMGGHVVTGASAPSGFPYSAAVCT